MIAPHLFVSSDGNLYDTRDSNWSHRAPLRTDYNRHFAAIETTGQFRATLRAGPFAWPGGYPLYLLCADGGALCFACARREYRAIAESISTRARDGWRVVACDIHYGAVEEGESELTCDHCSEAID